MTSAPGDSPRPNHGSTFRRAAVHAAFFIALTACTRKEPPGSTPQGTAGRESAQTPADGGQAGAAADAGPSGAAADADISSSGAKDAGSADAAAARPHREYKRVLHAGDSMVGGGLARALRPKWEAEGAKYIRDVWESGSLRDFARSDRIPTLLKRHKPDLIILNLGANDVYEKEPEVVAPFVEKIAKMVQGTECWWIGPPLWKKEYERIVATLRDHSAPCIFLDSSPIEMQRKKDGIHPDEAGGETWAAAIWAQLR